MIRMGLLLGMTLTLAGTPALAADRLSDKDVKALISRIEEGRDRFDDKLDGRIKDSIVRGPGGEVKVEHFLNDFQENIDKVEERLKPDYAASNEVAVLLRQGSAIDAYWKQHPPGTKGESEWNRLAGDLKALADAYGATFPLAENAPVRRIGDRELATEVEQVEGIAKGMKNTLNDDLKKDPSVDKATRESIVRDVDQFAKDAKSLAKRVKDGQPSSAEAERLLAGAGRLQQFMSSHQAPMASRGWATARSRLEKVASAYGRSWPGTN